LQRSPSNNKQSRNNPGIINNPYKSI